MSHHFQIIPECYADTVLVELLGFKGPNHQLGIGKVFGSFDKNYQNRLAVGIIDDDKVKPKDLDAFEKSEKKEGILRLKKGKHSILVISPAFEDWVFENAQATNTDPSKFGFRTSKDFQKACKRMDVSANQKVKEFLNALKQKEAPGFQQLKIWICEGAGLDKNEF